ncbi:hypothetical protein HDG38_002924 [Paraburkholderia sp. WSM4177]|nr:hypothetical protein [Paraburkholderia sp. WSM4177]MBB5484587.1 hypothetical protein [Paraburkholderia sp. WSM4180]
MTDAERFSRFAAAVLVVRFVIVALAPDPTHVAGGCKRLPYMPLAVNSSVQLASPVGRHSAGQSHRYFYMAEAAPIEYFIQGITSTGKKFRPSDWSERLAGVMSSFGPGVRKGPNAYMQYSLYVRPTMIGDLKCVILDSRLRDIEPMAFDFVMNFAKDNDLLVTEACELELEHAPAPQAKRHVI